MDFQKALTFLALIYLTYAGECENGWTAFRDELCIRTFTTDLLTFEDAANVCASQDKTGSLVLIKNQDIQSFITNYTNGLHDNVWLGAKYDNVSDEFLWSDGERLEYTNWGEGYPRNITDPDVCLYLRPANAKTSNLLVGNWEDSSCQRRNLAICQKPLSWTLQDAVNEIIRLRKDLDATTTKLDEVEGNVVPIGSIYVEYYGQPDPRTLWPTLSWSDVSNTYAGLFFRAYGGASASWGSKQNSCAPRFTQVQYADIEDVYSVPRLITLPNSGWSQYVTAGGYKGGWDYAGSLRFSTETCEVRPDNQAIRVWKRVA